MPEQSELINYYLQSLQDNLAHIVKEKALDEAKLKFKDVEIGEIQKKLEEGEERTENLHSKVIGLQDENEKLKNSASTVVELEKTIENLESRLSQTQTRCATLTAKVDQYHRNLKERDIEIEKLKEQKKPIRRRKKAVDTVS